jgi:hypothetical protein
VLCLAFQNGSDRLDGVATVELHGERMFGQYDACFFLVSLQDGLENDSNADCSDIVGRYGSFMRGLIHYDGNGMMTWWARGLVNECAA